MVQLPTLPNPAKHAAVHRLAIYDLDRTLTARPTWSLFLLGAARARAPWRLALVPLVAAAMAAHGIGLIGRTRLKEAMQRALLGGAMPATDLADLAERFAAAVTLRPGAVAQIAADRAAGYRPVLATAANDFYASAIARRLGIGDVVATTTRRRADGTVLARIEGANCYGAAKLDMVKRWLAAQGIDRTDAHVRVYSDHASDVPLLDWADAGFAVNPHRRLAGEAAARGWPILDWNREGNA